MKDNKLGKNGIAFYLTKHCKGDIVKVDKIEMRTNLYPNKEAVYAIEENIKKYALRPYRIRKMMEEYGMSEAEALQNVDSELLKLEALRCTTVEKKIYAER